MSKIFLTHKVSDKTTQMFTSSGHEIISSPEGGDAVLCLLTDKIDKKFMNAVGSQLKIVANCAVGFDNIDIETAKEKNIIVTNTPEVLSETVAEHTFALMLALAHRIVEADRFVRMGKFKGWESDLLLGQDMAHKVLGIVGLGRIGTLVAQQAVKGHQMKVIYYDLKRNEGFEKELGGEYKDNVEKVFIEADFVSMHLPYLPTTHHLVDHSLLNKMKSNAYLVNTSRGAIINENDLVKILREKKIAGAALDVFEHEPGLSPGLVNLENVILTPHIASATVETREKIQRLAVQNILNVLSGKEALTPIK
jgi:glyoxylate reductase